MAGEGSTGHKAKGLWVHAQWLHSTHRQGRQRRQQTSRATSSHFVVDFLLPFAESVHRLKGVVGLGFDLLLFGTVSAFWVGEK